MPTFPLATNKTDATATATDHAAHHNDLALGLNAAPRILARSAVPASVTGTLTETTLATVTIPGGTIGANGRLRITTLWTFTGSTNAKVLRVRLGGINGTSFLGHSQATAANVVARAQIEIANRNSESSQVGYTGGNVTTWGASTAAVTTGTRNTAADQDLLFTGTLTNTGETITLEYYIVELLP